jgi:CheY-like chemotaxis protein
MKRMQLEVMIIDDDFDEVAIFEDLIKDFPYDIQCTYAESGEKGLELLRLKSPDIIFLDVNMPRMNGIECLSRIRNQENLRDIPVVINSNGVTKCMKDLTESLGAAACFKKSGNITQMKATLREILDENFKMAYK